VKGFGRVIIVWEEVEGFERAKREGDYLKLDVELPPAQPEGVRVDHDEEYNGKRDSEYYSQRSSPLHPKKGYVITGIITRCAPAKHPGSYFVSTLYRSLPSTLIPPHSTSLRLNQTKTSSSPRLVPRPKAGNQ
jgi:hypothetical protein